MNNLKGRTGIFLTLLSISILLIILLLSLNPQKENPKNTEIPQLHIHNHKHLQIAHSVCEGTLYPQLCVSTLSSLPDLTSKSLPQIISAAVNHTVYEVRDSESNYTRLRKKLIKHLDPRDNRALDDCLSLLDDTMYELKSVISNLSPNKTTSKHYHVLQTLLSGAMTNQYTCLDGFAYSKGNVRNTIKHRLYQISHHVSNSLFMVKKIPGVNTTKPEVFPEYGAVRHGFPSWLYKRDRKLLQTSVNETKYDLIVAKDGTGNFTTISEAVAAAPNSSATRFVIYIKAGAYFENVEVERKKTMLMFVGDGVGKTIVKASRNVVDGWTTFQSATVAVVGDGFIAKGITIENAAGPSKHQAVALRSGADLSAFYQCSFVGYQDTLYVHSLRQFYRDCDVYGTIDFIFGNAAVVLQDCNLYARKPNENQKNLFTAQGRDDPNQNTGISILNCKITAASDLIPVQSSFKTYLGRPWKEYSRTVILRSNIDDLVDPAGWLEWNGTFALSTLYYGEYMNRGPGSNTSARVTWPGYRVINSSTEASQFTVANFLQGNEWLLSTGIPYYLNLS
ncbi:Pectinesterase domain-containing protein/PMEI domain-containing protein [Cephalotus follicularis]|uniref:Pectinesterase n=1 Tax=Cephalotus follicularis TaxID=3775 RepID=A0A1Q3B3Z5_CEPFO|nr:Pectinesterase domain-containing protein/PMEI domain-containing protein [Cephalotus follicularis]